MNNFIPTSEHNYEVNVSYSDTPVYKEESGVIKNTLHYITSFKDDTEYHESNQLQTGRQGKKYLYALWVDSWILCW